MELIKKETIETYTYNFSRYKKRYEIVIIFINDKFEEVEFDFTGHYSRDEFHILAEIDAEISRIDAEKEKTA